MNWLNDNVNALSLLGAAAILILTFFVVGKYMKQMKTDKASGELAKENWDGIGEYKNALPIGWALSFLGTIAPEHRHVKGSEDVLLLFSIRTTYYGLPFG